MTEAESIIKQNMAKLKISHACEMAGRIGITKQNFSRKLKNPRTFSWYEVGEMAKQFNWSDAELGEFVRSVYDRKD